MSDSKDFLSVSLELAAMEQLELPAMEMLFRLEYSGEDFSDDVADRVGNEAAADLLRRNAREETIHGRRVTDAMAILEQSSGS